MLHTVAEHGFAIVPRVIARDALPTLVDEAERLFADQPKRSAGVRRVLPQSAVFTTLAQSPAIRQLVEPTLGNNAMVVRSILFDKTQDANWDVAWHQDTTIAVAERIDAPGFGPWSMKAGVTHVRPPASILEDMLTVRVHLDPCNESDGPLLVASGSHRMGVAMEPHDAAAFEANCIACTTDAGGAVLMRPLLFHASRKATHPTHRRVLHLEFASGPLAPPLQWACV